MTERKGRTVPADFNRYAELVDRYEAPEEDVVVAARSVANNGYRPIPIARLREAMGIVGLAAELAKKDAERKRIHLMLNDAGIPSESAGSGEGICLEGRIALALNRLER